MKEETIRTLCAAGNWLISAHARKRMIQRGITTAEIERALLTGEIIEDYPDAYYGPACLLLALSSPGTPLHIVCGENGGSLFVITAYRPTPEKWDASFRKRRNV